MNEGEKLDKYLDLARGMKKLWNIEVTLTPIGIVSKNLGKRLGELEISEITETPMTTSYAKIS